jgi:hypothetical protein
MDPKEESEATATEVDTINQEFAYRRTGFHEPTSPMRVSATRRFFFGGSGALSGSSLSTGGVAVASPVLALELGLGENVALRHNTLCWR